MAQNEQPTYCTKCGAKLGEGLLFCTSCGEPVAKTESSHVIEEKEELLPPTAAKNRKVAIALVSALATVALVLGVVWLFRGGNAESEETASVSDVASATEPAAASNVNTSAKTTSEQQPKEMSASEVEPSSPAGNVQSTNASQETQGTTNTPEKDGLYAFNYSGSYTPELDTASLQQIVSSGPVASGDTVASSEWATAVRNSGVLRVGGAKASMLFAYEDGSGQVRGFDAALYQLLVRYIFGNESALNLTRITTATREQVLQDGSVDVVCATYTITPERAQSVSFAGPYFQTRQGLMVRAGETSIRGIGDLSRKSVGVEAGSVAVDVVAQYEPDARIQTYENDSALMQALETGAIDAYVTDSTILMGDMVQYPGRFNLLGEFGPVESYGIGLPYGSDGAMFVNEFLTQIEADGTWTKLWQTCFGKRVGIANTPNPPAIG